MPTITVGDLDIHYDTAGHGEPLVCLHGNWGSARWFEPLLARLPTGLHAHVPELRGRGRTRGPAGDVTIPALARDLLAFLDAMQWPSAHLVGHSLGAGVVLQLALDAPRRVRSLLCLAPPWIDGMPRVPGVAERQRQLAADRAGLAAAMRFLFARPPDPATFERLVDDAFTQRLEATVATVAALEDWRPGRSLSAISAPRHVVVGDRDILVTPQHAAQAAEALGCGLTVLPGIGHALLPEAPQAIADALATLLAA